MEQKTFIKFDTISEDINKAFYIHYKEYKFLEWYIRNIALAGRQGRNIMILSIIAIFLIMAIADQVSGGATWAGWVAGGIGIKMMISFIIGKIRHHIQGVQLKRMAKELFMKGHYYQDGKDRKPLHEEFIAELIEAHVIR